jgi:protein O-GlcNAc transferase
VTIFGRLLAEIAAPSAQALCREGARLYAEGRLEEAQAAFARALGRDDGCLAAHSGLGVLYRRRGELQRALRHLRRAIELDPRGRDLHLLAAQALLEAGEQQEAIARLAELRQARPGDASIELQYARALQAGERIDEARATLEALTGAQPGHAAALEALAALHRDCGLGGEALAAYRRVAELRPDLATAASAALFHEQYLEHDRDALFRRHVEWGERHAAKRHGERFAGRDRSPERVLRLGYVSADFNASSAAFFLEPLFEHHQGSRFELVGYHSSTRRDAQTEKLRARAFAWREVDGLDDAALCALIERDAIDILVDLNGHTRGGRLTVFGRKPAPIQVTYLGYGASTGVAAIDYRITDRWIDPPGEAERYYTERLVWLAQSMWCFKPPAAAPEVTRLPASASGQVNFASLNSFSKVSHTVLETWARILARLPQARLTLVSVPAGESEERVQQIFARHGVAPSRLRFAPRLPFAQYLALHGEVDIALDAFPYCGGATTCTALWMGVPVLTLAGKAALARSGRSLLSTVGLGDWVADSLAEYEAKAIALASDLGALERVRSALRERVARSPLCDAPAFVRELESHYREMWRSWCSTKPTAY